MTKKILCLRHLGHENFWKILHDAGQMSSHSDKSTILTGKKVLVLMAGDHTAERDMCVQAVADMGGQSTLVTMDTKACDTTGIQAALATQPADICVSYGVPTATLEHIAETLTIPLLCGSSDDTQIAAALGDLTLLRSLHPAMDTMRIGWVGGATPVAHTLIEASMYVPYELFMALPEWGEPDKNLLGLALTTGAKIFLTRERHLAVDEAHFVYAGACSPATPAENIHALRASMVVDDSVMALAQPHARLLLGKPWSSACRVPTALVQSPASLHKEQGEYTLRIYKTLLPLLLNSAE